LETLRKAVRKLLEKFLEESEKEVRRIGVKVSQLAKEEASQKRLESYFGT